MQVLTLKIDPRKANELVRGMVSLPHGTGARSAYLSLSAYLAISSYSRATLTPPPLVTFSVSISTSLLGLSIGSPSFAVPVAAWTYVSQWPSVIGAQVRKSKWRSLQGKTGGRKLSMLERTLLGNTN